jgi:hypothetical protein
MRIDLAIGGADGINLERSAPVGKNCHENHDDQKD